MQRRGLSRIFISAFLLLILINLSFSLVLAAEPALPNQEEGGGTPSPTQRADVQAQGDQVQFSDSNNDFEITGFDCTKPLEEQGAFLEQRYCLWTKGARALDASDPNNKAYLNILGETLKWTLLMIVISFSYIGFGSLFPKNKYLILKSALAIIIGFLATFLITTQELISLLLSYSALGMVLGVLAPLLALLGLTILFAKSATPGGFFFSKVLWLLYSFYLLVRSLTYLILLNSKFDEEGDITLPIWGKLFKFLIRPMTNEAIKTIQSNYDVIVLAGHLILAVGILYFMVFKNSFESWVAHEDLRSKIEAKRQEYRKADAVSKLNAERLDNQ